MEVKMKRSYLKSLRRSYQRDRIDETKRAKIARIADKYPGLIGSRFVANLFKVSVSTIYRVKKEYTA